MPIVNSQAIKINSVIKSKILSKSQNSQTVANETKQFKFSQIKSATIKIVLKY